MVREEVIDWLLEGDVSIQYQTHRDLLNSDPGVLSHLKKRISTEGWGRAFLDKQDPKGIWGRAFYQPKWISTHYTMLDLRYLCIDITPEIKKALDLICGYLRDHFSRPDPKKQLVFTDACIHGMLLNYASYFKTNEEELRPVIDYIISQQMTDGGFNCLWDRMKVVHSSVHTTISILEGIREYINQGYSYRSEELLIKEKESQEFLLKHRLFRSDKTGEIIHPGMLKLVYPPRWKYDILRALDYFQYAKAPYDERMSDAISVLLCKKTKDNIWKEQAHYKGEVHFEMEPAGKPGRWNTLRAMRVLDRYIKFFRDDI